MICSYNLCKIKEDYTFAHCQRLLGSRIYTEYLNSYISVTFLIGVGFAESPVSTSCILSHFGVCCSDCNKIRP